MQGVFYIYDLWQNYSENISYSWKIVIKKKKKKPLEQGTIFISRSSLGIIWCFWWFCQGAGAREKEFLLHFRNQFWSVQRRKAGSLQIHTKTLPRSSSSCKFPVKNSLETNPELSQEPNSFPTPAQGWICDPGSQTWLWMCIWGWEETSSSFFSSQAWLGRFMRRSRSQL